MTKKNQEISTTLQYKPLYNISRSERRGKKIQGAAYNGARTVFRIAKKVLLNLLTTNIVWAAKLGLPILKEKTFFKSRTVVIVNVKWGFPECTYSL